MPQPDLPDPDIDRHRRFGAAELQEFLQEVNQEMEALGSEPSRLIVIGGASMLTRMAARVTGDVDVISEGMDSTIRQAARTVAGRHNLAPDWINDGAKGLAVGIEVEPETIFKGSHLIVESAGPRYLLAMKLAAARPEDAADAIHLARELRIGSTEELLDLVEQALHPPRQPTPKMAYWAEEIFVRARRWRHLWLARQALARLRTNLRFDR